MEDYEREEYIIDLSDHEARDLTENIYILVHGVESRAEGMQGIRDEMIGDKKYGGKFPYPYDRIHIHNYWQFPVLFLALPISYLLNIRKVYSDYLGTVIENKSRLYPNAEIHVVAHSWGTFQFQRVLIDEQFKSLSFGHVILLGSVMNEEFPWAKILGKRVDRVDNYVSRFDYVQWLSSLGFVGMGGSGRYGFHTSGRSNRLNDYYTNWSHTSYAGPENRETIVNRILNHRDFCLKGG